MSSKFGVPPRRYSSEGCASATSPWCRRPHLEARAPPLALRRGIEGRADRARHQGGRPLARAGGRVSLGGYGGPGQARSLHERRQANERRATRRRTRHASHAASPADVGLIPLPSAPEQVLTRDQDGERGSLGLALTHLAGVHEVRSAPRPRDGLTDSSEPGVGVLWEVLATRCAAEGLSVPTAARLWRHLVGLERSGLVTREVRLGRPGGSRTLVTLAEGVNTGPLSP